MLDKRVVKIELGNSYCKLLECPDDVKDKLYKELSYETDNSTFLKIKTRRFWMDSRKYLFNRKTNKFPSGLLKRAIGDILSFQNIDLQFKDSRTRPGKSLYLPLSQGLPKVRFYQQDCIDLVDGYNRGTFELATGTGKSLLMTHIIHKVGVPTLVIVPTRLLVTQTVKNLQLAFGKKHVGTHKDKHDPKPITVMTQASLPKMEQGFFDRFQMLILDEAHRSSSRTFRNANKKNWNHMYFRYHVTATCFRNDGSDLELEGMVGDPIYRYGAAQAIKDGFLAKPYFFIYTVPNPKSEMVVVRSMEYQEEYKSMIVENKRRNEMIRETTKCLQSSGKQILLLVEHVEHGEHLKELITDVTFIHGNTKGNQKVIEDFEQGKVKTLMATSGILGEGIDISNINVLVLCGGMKAESQTIQKIGRMLRKREGKDKAVVIDFYDQNTKTLERHSRARIEVYETYESEIKYL